MKNKLGFTIQEKTTYINDVEKFLQKIDVKCKITFIDVVYKWGNNRNKFKVVLKNKNNQQFTYYFYDSVNNFINTIFPSVYDVLSCVGKNEIESDIQFFADCYGYEIESIQDFRKVEKIQKACIREYNGIKKIFKNHIEELQEVAE